MMGTLGGLYPAWRAARLMPDGRHSAWDRTDDTFTEVF